MARRQALARAGFTMTELLVVIAIIAILMVLLVTLLGVPAVKRAQEKKTLAVFSAIEQAVEDFKRTNNDLPRLTADGIIATLGGGPYPGAPPPPQNPPVKDYLRCYEFNTGMTLVGQAAPYDYLEANAALFLQLCVDQVTDSAGSAVKIPAGGPFLEATDANSTFVDGQGVKKEQTGDRFNVFVDAWGTPLRVALPTASASYMRDKIVLRSAGPDQMWDTDDDMENIH